MGPFKQECRAILNYIKIKNFALVILWPFYHYDNALYLHIMISRLSLSIWVATLDIILIILQRYYG